MTTLRIAAALVLAYGLWGASQTVAHVLDGGAALALSQGLIRLAGVVLLAWGLYRARAWAWWFVMAVAGMAVVAAAVLLGMAARSPEGVDWSVLPLLILPAAVVACLALPAAWRTSRAFGRRAALKTPG